MMLLTNVNFGDIKPMELNKNLIQDEPAQDVER
jgi:hypothetical protein